MSSDCLAYDCERILAMPEVGLGTADEALPEVHNCLRRYGYLKDADITAVDILDDPTSGALKSFQQFYNIPQTGIVDERTKEAMAQTRCALPDLMDQSLEANLAGAWKHRDLTYSFGHLSRGVSAHVCRDAVRRALDTWTQADAGLTFTEVPRTVKPDISIEWRHADDADHSMRGPVLAHADFPPGFSMIVKATPLPLHFDDEEHAWVDGEVEDAFDIETTCLHELGHCLGLYHSNVPGSIMFPTVSSNHAQRSLAGDDVEGIQRLYPRL